MRPCVPSNTLNRVYIHESLTSLVLFSLGLLQERELATGRRIILRLRRSVNMVRAVELYNHACRMNGLAPASPVAT